MPILLGSQAPSEVASVWAEESSASAQEKTTAASITADAATQAAFATFLRDYHQALLSGNTRFLTDHTNFPLPIAEIEYDMEVKVRHSKLASVTKLLRARERVRWPAEVVPKGPEELGRLRRGTQKCDDPKAPDKPNFAQGEPAIVLHDDSAMLTYLAEPCAAETHLVTLVFTHAGKSWRLRERTVKKGIQ